MVSFPSFIPRKGTATQAEPKEPRRYSKFSSGLDFSDGRPPSFTVPLTPPPDILIASAQASTPSAPLRQNKSEQTRLQGLMRSETIDRRGVDEEPSVSRWKQLKVWMTNEGELARDTPRRRLETESEGAELTMTTTRRGEQALDASSLASGSWCTLSSLHSDSST